jgi:hypothetical protein
MGSRRGSRPRLLALDDARRHHSARRQLRRLSVREMETAFAGRAPERRRVNGSRAGSEGGASRIRCGDARYRCARVAAGEGQRQTTSRSIRTDLARPELILERNSTDEAARRHHRPHRRRCRFEAVPLSTAGGASREVGRPRRGFAGRVVLRVRGADLPRRRPSAGSRGRSGAIARGQWSSAAAGGRAQPRGSQLPGAPDARWPDAAFRCRKRPS